MCLFIVSDSGEQADNGQYAENDFAWVQTFLVSVIRKVLDGLDDEVNHCADSLEDRAEYNHAHRLLSINMHKQFTDHLVKEFRVVQHLLDFFLEQP